MANRDIVVIGGSAGCTACLKLLMQGHPADFLLRVFVTTDLPSQHEATMFRRARERQLLGGAGVDSLKIPGLCASR
jgi:chemotaxis response regulator CheB